MNFVARQTTVHAPGRCTVVHVFENEIIEKTGIYATIMTHNADDPRLSIILMTYYARSTSVHTVFPFLFFLG